ncbi:hypothetical protein F5Y07DRAFT_365179 [Xylaria sp. FL0933]|nr:hypothetical protein F5Y07DRAFT_365179 [Xylaria sp. FL0933]
MLPPRVIKDWIQSVSPPDGLAYKRKREDCYENNGKDDSGHHLKRRRQRREKSPEDCRLLSMAPSTPPPSNNLSSSNSLPTLPPKQGQKRGSTELADNESDDVFIEGAHFEHTPKPKPKNTSRKAQSAGSSPAKRSKPRKKPISRIPQLNFLSKPVNSTPLDEKGLPEDVKLLHEKIVGAASFKDQIVPHELREILQSSAPFSNFPRIFREPEQSAPDKDTFESEVKRAVAIALKKDRAEQRHHTLDRICQAAATSDNSKRPEPGWNHHVHTPILDIVFGSLVDPDRTMHASEWQSCKIAVRHEAVMTTTMADDTIPQNNYPTYASSVSRDSPAASYTTSDQSYSVSFNEAAPDQVHSSSGTKKVDYVLVMQLHPENPLWKQIQTYAFKPEQGFAYVNQTLQDSLLLHPIAASIETKPVLPQTDSLVQLGFWTAAWHQRMYTIRHKIFPLGSTEDKPSSKLPKLITLPLIAVKGHYWFIYYACDRGSSIEISGPANLGSTLTMADLYALIASLGFVKDWIYSAFYDGIFAWFNYDNLHEYWRSSEAVGVISGS